MAALDRFLFILGAMFFVPMLLLFADLFYREYAHKLLEWRKVGRDTTLLQVPEPKVS